MFAAIVKPGGIVPSDPWNEYIKKLKGMQRVMDLHETPQCQDKCYIYPWLKDHMDNLHGTKQFSCDLCEYTTLVPKEFKKHWKFRHDPSSSSRIPCDQCHFSATRADTLKKHIQIMHENVRYPCDQCGFKGKSKTSVLEHKQKVHENLKLPCDLCKGVYPTSNALKLHKRRMHPDEYV